MCIDHMYRMSVDEIVVAGVCKWGEWSGAFRTHVLPAENVKRSGGGEMKFVQPPSHTQDSESVCVWCLRVGGEAFDVHISLPNRYVS